MLRFILCVLLIVNLFSSATQAQIPKYRFSKFDTTGIANLSRGFTADNAGLKYQFIYYPTNFPGMPAGQVSAIYIRVGRNPLGVSTSTYPFFTVKIGYTNDSTFPNGSNKYDTFKTGLTTIYGPATFTATGTDSIGRWIKIPVTKGVFSFSPERKFVVEIAEGPKSNGTGFDIMTTNLGTIFKNRNLGGQRDSMRAFNNTSIAIADLGIDLATTGINGISNITSFGLFPNPASHGNFNISFDAQQPLKEVLITVTSVTGQVVQQQAYRGIGISFFKEIDMQDAAKGIYLVTLDADGETITRRVIVE